MAKETFKFINPYNFIPLSKTIAAPVEEEEKKLKGVIEYSLITKTPLFIPNTSNDHAICPEAAKDEKTGNIKEDYHKSYEFFAYEDLSSETEKKKEENLLPPVIPGSEIRGMFRSNYEILTNSCLSAVDEDVVLSRRNPQVFKAALIHRTASGKYELIEGVDRLLRTYGENSLTADLNWDDDNDHNSRKCYKQDKLSEGQKVFIDEQRRASYMKPVVVSISCSKPGIEGYVLKGEEGPEMKDDQGNTLKNQKHCCHIISAKRRERKDVVLTGNLDISLLDTVLKIYKDNGEHLYTEYSNAWEDFKKGKGNFYFPVYYSTIDTRYYMLSPAAMTIEVFQAKLSGLVASHKACRDKKKLCPACKLFGTIQKDEKGKNFSVASRVRFSDLNAVQYTDIKKLYEQPIMLKELSSPKLGNIEFYLKRPENALFWNYDYYIDKEGNPHSYTAEISGRKFYWHDLGMNKDQIKADEQTIRNTTVRPVTSNVVFKGKVFFDGITVTELNQLLYLVNVGEFSDAETALKDKAHGYKLGGAKPLGFGSVALQVDQVKLRSVKMDSDNRTIIQNCSDIAPKYIRPAFAEDIIADFEKMTSFSALEKYAKDGYKLSYPMLGKADKNGEKNIYDWFVANHFGYDLKKHREVGMPNARSQLVILEHMEPMNPVLVSTGFSKNTTSQTYKSKKKFGNQFEIGKKYKATVTGRKKEKVVFIQLENGWKDSVFDRGKKSIGDPITVTYVGEKKGSDGRMHPDWKIAE